MPQLLDTVQVDSLAKEQPSAGAWTTLPPDSGSGTKALFRLGGLLSL